MIRVRGVGTPRQGFYWGIEHDSASPDRRPLAWAFLVETNPPWRRSTRAIRFRLGRKELHLGLCKPGSDPEKVIPTPQSDPEVTEALRALYDADAATWDATKPITLHGNPWDS